MEKAKYISLIIIATLLWGVTFPIMKIAVVSISPVLLTLIRFAIASAILFAIFFKRIVSSSIGSALSGLFIGVFLYFGYYFQIVGIVFTSAMHSTLITGLYIIISPILAFFMLKEPLDKKVIISLILALIGLFLITGILITVVNIGDILTFFSAISYSFQVVLVDKYSKKYDPLVLTFYQILMVVPLGLIFLPFSGYSVSWNNDVIFSIIYLSIFATAIALLLQNFGQKGLDSATASMVFALEPVFGVLFSILLLHETMGILQILGGVLMISAMIIISSRRNH
ncbi:MAG: DMT family transporter [Thermoplasmata archaeon]|nr:DMT family transporter [Thermoplasmata archaeon]